MAFNGDFEPVLAKHTKNFSLQNALSIGVDSMHRNFKPMVESVERWQAAQLSDVSARLIIYRAFIEAELEAPRHLDRKVHDLYFNPRWKNFRRGLSRVNYFFSLTTTISPYSGSFNCRQPEI
jgi:hypothetical protein